MATKTTVLPNIGEVRLYKRKGLRNMKVSVGHDGSIRVSLPFWVPFSSGIELVKRHKDWIDSRRTTPALLVNGDQIGLSHKLVFVPVGKDKEISTRVAQNGDIRVLCPVGMNFSEPAVQNAARQACIRALKVQANKVLPKRLKNLADFHGFNFNNVRIKQLKSRWGSCSSNKEIVLNCFLMQLPTRLIDYVIFHELLHTRRLAHGPAFWTELENYVPNLKSTRKEIRNYRPVLLTDA